MRDSDRKRFVEAWCSCYELVGAPIPTARAMEMAFALLRDIDVSEVMSALQTHAQTSVYPPKPTDVIRQCRGSAEDRARRAWLDVCETMRRWGSHESVNLGDPWAHYAIAAMGGWPAIGGITADEAPWREKDFCRHYADAARMGLSWGAPGVPDHLPGNCEIANRSCAQAPVVAIRRPDEVLRLRARDDVAAAALPRAEMTDSERLRNIDGVRCLVAEIGGRAR